MSAFSDVRFFVRTAVPPGGGVRVGPPPAAPDRARPRAPEQHRAGGPVHASAFLCTSAPLCCAATALSFSRVLPPT